ncbi:MAG: amidohydrolase family protein [Planctomycetaceae bacterium]
MTPTLHTSHGEATFQAQAVIIGDGQLLRPGWVHVRAGRIIELASGRRGDAIDLGPVAILPPLVNAHTHLEFSDLTTPLPPGRSFPDWIDAVLRERQSRVSSITDRIERGWRESTAAGVAAIGEIATTNDTCDTLSRLGASGVVFREFLGLTPERIAAAISAASSFLDAAINADPPALRRGLSPHAPYSTHPDLVARLCELAAERQAPVAMHLAETREELQLLTHRTGPFVDFLQRLGVWRDDLFDRGDRILDSLRHLARAPRALVVHGNYLGDADCEFIASQPHMSVVYCPRTHAAFQHDPHPWRKLLRQGTRVVLGTDSRATNPDLSLWNELQWLATRCDLPDATLLRMVTIDAALALGLPAESACLQVGGPARFLSVRPARPLSDDSLAGLLARR